VGTNLNRVYYEGSSDPKQTIVDINSFQVGLEQDCADNIHPIDKMYASSHATIRIAAIFAHFALDKTVKALEITADNMASGIGERNEGGQLNG
jgi:hypothetical protein